MIEIFRYAKIKFVIKIILKWIGYFALIIFVCLIAFYLYFASRDGDKAYL